MQNAQNHVLVCVLLLSGESCTAHGGILFFFFGKQVISIFLMGHRHLFAFSVYAKVTYFWNALVKLVEVVSTQNNSLV